MKTPIILLLILPLQIASASAGERVTVANGAAAPGLTSGQLTGQLKGQKTIVFVGDSLTEGYGVKLEQAFPAIAGEILRKDKHDIKIVNGGISGSVSADADRRVTWFLKVKPDILVLELGSNDALKGTPVAVIEKNLEHALLVADNAHLKVLILGMHIYTNFGPVYAKKFAAIFPKLAKEHHAALVPFLLEDVALKPALMQSDQKHPNVEGHALVAKRVAAALEKLL
jgi:acyl-CoA thioesterase-1